MSIAEKLKNCPEGTKLYSTIWGEVTFIKVNGLNNIEVKDRDGFRQVLYPNGKYSELGEVILFPSETQYDWDEFKKFKYGDFVAIYNEVYQGYNIGIFDEYIDDNFCKLLCVTSLDGGIDIVDEDYDIEYGWDAKNVRYANSIEQTKLLDELDKIGYKWENNKLTIKPKFKVGDRITDGPNTFTINAIRNNCYYLILSGIVINEIPFSKQDNWKLAKFDPKTLTPFQKVLVRHGRYSRWCCDMFSYIDEDNKFVVTGHIIYNQCVPYNNDTAHLVGTSDGCPEYYKIW